MFKTFKLYINFHGFLNLYPRQLVYLGFVVWLYYVGFIYGYFDSSAVPNIAPLFAHSGYPGLVKKLIMFLEAW